MCKKEVKLLGYVEYELLLLFAIGSSLTLLISFTVCMHILASGFAGIVEFHL